VVVARRRTQATKLARCTAPRFGSIAGHQGPLLRAALGNFTQANCVNGPSRCDTAEWLRLVISIHVEIIFDPGAGKRGVPIETFTLTGLAQASGLSVQAIEVLQERGLLPPPRRRPSRSGGVAFHREHLERLHAVGRGISLGFALDELQVILGAGSLLTCNDIYAITQSAVQRLRSEGLGETAPIVVKLRALIKTSPRTGSKFNCPIYLEIAGTQPQSRRRRHGRSWRPATPSKQGHQ
jgi:DNA-binding transcriptional MerR regulator